jgi:TM2 domain-containing membrane protein YozV
MKNKVVAAVLALFLGGLGIHKFYLGQNFAGIMYLLFSWTFVPGIIAFFEFLGLLLMSDRAFDAQYNQGTLQYSNSLAMESSKDRMATLEELKKLYDAEIITAEEYEEKRRKILDSL